MEQVAEKEKDTQISALIERGKNLLRTHRQNPSAKPPLEDYAVLAEDWSAFLAAHPENNAETHESFKRFLDDLSELVLGMERNGYTPDEVEAFRAHCRGAFSDVGLTRHVPAVNRLWHCSVGILPIGCVSREMINPEVLGGHVKYRVDACNQLMANSRKEEAREIIVNLRRMFSLTPDVKAWSERVQLLEVRAVCDYEAPLRLWLWGDYCKPENYVQMFRNWRAFFKAHPVCDRLYFDGYEAFLNDAHNFVAGLEQGGCTSPVFSECKMMVEKGWRAMPFGARTRKRGLDARQSLSFCFQDKAKVVSQGSNDYKDGMPLHVNWEITSFCNFSCSYCVQASGGHKKGFCTLEQAETAVKHIASSNRSAFDVTLIGGEPTAHPHLAEIIMLLQKHLGDKLERIAIVSNGSFSERQMDAVLGVKGQTEITLIISIHLEYMGVDRVVSLVKRLSNQVALQLQLMFHPDLFDKAKAMADALCELRKEYPFGMDVGMLREPPVFDQWDSRYTRQHLDWVEETRKKINSVAARGPKGNPMTPKKVQRKYWVKKELRIGCKMYEGVDEKRLKQLTQYEFRGMTCCVGISVLRILEDGSAMGAVCGSAKPVCNLFDENPFEREDWVHGVRCNKKMCGCNVDHRIPKFGNKEEAERFMAEQRQEHKRLLDEYKKDGI